MESVCMNSVVWLILFSITFWAPSRLQWGFHGGSDGKVSACNVGDPGLIPGLGRSPGEGNGNPLPGKFHGLRSLVGYSPWGRKELDTTEQLHFTLTMDYNPPGYIVLCPWVSPGKNTEVGCHFLLQGIFLTQGSTLRLLHWQADSLLLSDLGGPFMHTKN